MHFTHKLLIVEDDVFIAELYKEIFESSGYSTTLVDDGEKALKAILKNKWDGILMDINLPKKNAEDILSSLKHSDYSFKTPIIITTNNVPSEVSASIKKRASIIIDKSAVNPDQLIALVSKYIS